MGAMGMGAAYAEEDGDAITNTQFTSIPGVLAQAPVQNPTSAVAQSGEVHVFATQSRSNTAIFKPGSNNG